MNTTDKKVLEYLKRAGKIYDSFFTMSDSPLRDSNAVTKIATLIQTEELNDSNMQLFKDKN